MRYNFGKYIGLSYKELGRDFSGVDCYGIIVLIFKNELGIDLPDFTDLLYAKDRFNILNKSDHILNSIGIQWIPINEPYKIFDGLIFNSNKDLRFTNHVGMYIGDEKFIHIIVDSTSLVSRLDDLFWSRKLYGAMRFKGAIK